MSLNSLCPNLTIKRKCPKWLIGICYVLCYKVVWVSQSDNVKTELQGEQESCLVTADQGVPDPLATKLQHWILSMVLLQIPSKTLVILMTSP